MVLYVCVCVACNSKLLNRLVVWFCEKNFFFAFNQLWRHCKSFGWTRSMPWSRSFRSTGKIGTPWWVCSRNIRMWKRHLRWSISLRNNGSNTQTDKRLCSRMWEMIATTSGSLRRTNGNSIVAPWSPSRSPLKSRTPKTESRTCSTSDWTKWNSIWKTIGWKCSRMARRHPWWCRVSVVCTRTGRVFDVEFDSYGLDVPLPVCVCGERKKIVIWCARRRRRRFLRVTYAFSESEVGTDEGEWHWYTEPQGQ